MSKYNRNQILKIRYAVYRDLGYTSYEANRLKNRKFDISGIKLDKENNVIKGNNYKNLVKNKRGEDYKSYANSIQNDTVLSNWGMLTTDDRYRHETVEYVNQVRRDLRITNDQAYYFVYIMLTYNLTYEETKQQLLSSKEFEVYRSKSGSGKPRVYKNRKGKKRK